jgi:hypothetical protein
MRQSPSWNDLPVLGTGLMSWPPFFMGSDDSESVPDEASGGREPSMFTTTWD